MSDNEIPKATKQNRKAILSRFAAFMTILIGGGIFGLSILLPFYRWATSIGPWGFFLLVTLAVIYIFIGYYISRYVYPKLQKFKTKNKEGLGSFRAFSFGLFIVLCYLIVLYSVLHCYNELSELASHHFGFTLSEISYDNAVKVCIAILALFTLMIAVWRGALHSLQEKAQSKQAKIVADQIILGNRQFELANRQFDLATENLIETQNNNIAKLLIDGTKLLGDGTTEAEKMAGIACLANIINGQNRFIKQAVDVLKSAIITYGKANQDGINMQELKDPWFFYAMDTLQDFTFQSKQEISVFGIVLKGRVRTKKGVRWPNLSEIQYKNVSFHVVDFAGIAQFYIEDCYIMDSFIDDGCRFETIQSKRFSSDGLIGNNVKPSHFLSCIFRNITSSSYPVHGVMLDDFKHDFIGCYYDDSEIAGVGEIVFFEKHGITRLSKSSSCSLCANKENIR